MPKHLRLIRSVLSVCALLALPCSTAFTAEKTSMLDLMIRHTAGGDNTMPVTGGVPLAEGDAPEGVNFVLRDGDGATLPLQTEVLAQWPDGSARWLLLDFKPGASTDSSRCALSWGSDQGPQPDMPAGLTSGDAPVLSSGPVKLHPAKGALFGIGERSAVRLTLRDREGRTCSTILESMDRETEGALRSSVLFRGSFKSPDGDRLFRFRVRVSVFAGSNRFLIEPMINMDSEQGLMQYFKELNLEFVTRQPVRGAVIGGDSGFDGDFKAPLRLLQKDDQHYVFEGTENKGRSAPGWVTFNDGGGMMSIAMRDFWQQWPKSIELNQGSIVFGLFPRFSEGEFDHMEPWYKYRHLYEGDCYRMRTGQSRRWRIWCELGPDGAALSRQVNAPPVLVAEPVQALATGSWGAVAAAGTPGMEDYDEWARNLIAKGYLQSISQQRDYGEMNWGDWFGERQANWGNHEYDTPKHLLVEFARTGDPRCFYVGDCAARHMSEVDVINFVNDDLRSYFEDELGGNDRYPVRPGMVHEHCVGHVSGFYPVRDIKDIYLSFNIGNSANPYLCLDPYNLGHIWTQGMVYHYFLTGDRWVRETVERIGENLRQLVEDRQYRFKGTSHCGRTNGWTMLAIAGAYELGFDDRYLGAMKLLAEDALSEQDPNCGGWLYTLPRGHCNCETKHVGEAGFIGSVRLNGLAKYYELTGDERIPPAVTKAVTHLNRDTWVEEWSDWRYTSCPATGPIGQIGVTIMSLVNSVNISGDEEQLRILNKAWDAKFARLRKMPAARPGVGKTLSLVLYGSPEAMNFFVNGSDR